MSAYFVGSLCTEQCFKVRNYKILPRSENLRLCMTAKFNKNETNINMEFSKQVEKRTLITVIAFYNLYICSREQ